MKIAAIRLLPSFDAAKYGANQSNRASISSLQGCNYMNDYSREIAFASNSVSFDCEILTTSDEKLENEIRLSTLARSKGVDTPKISSSKTYLIHGRKADDDEVEITNGHVRNVLKNLLILDENDIYHGDVEVGHVFYSQKSDDVELDCFKFGCILEENDEAKNWMRWEFPPSIYPTNIMQYENNCIGDCLSRLDDEDEKNGFIKMYLKEASRFHSKKAEYLENIGAPFEQVEYEKTKSIAYENADDDVLETIKGRINFKYMERAAFTKVDNGYGACGHKKDEKLVHQGISDYLDTMQAAIEHISLLNSLIRNCDNSSFKKKYLEDEAGYAQFWFKNYTNSVCGNTIWALNPENKDNKTHRNVSQEERDELDKMFSLLRKVEDTKEQTEIISEIKSYYGTLLDKG